MNKMNIRKIIKEEMDDFDWVRNITPFDIDSLWIIHNDGWGTEEILINDREIQEWLESNGYRWNGGTLEIEDMIDMGNRYIFKEDDNRKWFDAYNRWNSSLDELVSNGYTLHKWSEIRPYVLNLK